MENNPIRLVDPTGLGPEEPGEDLLVIPDDPKNLDKDTWIKQRPNNLPEAKEGHTEYYKHKDEDIWLAYDEANSNKPKNNKAHYHLIQGDGKGGVTTRRFNANGDLLPKHLTHHKQSHLYPNNIVRLGRAISNLGGACAIILDISAIFTDSPLNPLYMMYEPGDGEENRAYLRPQTGLIYEWNTRSSGIRQVNYFMSYDYINGEWRGVGQYRTDYFDSNGQRLSVN